MILCGITPTISLTQLPTLCILFMLLMDFLPKIAEAQNPDPLFELPVQLIGFPVIILSVRLSQFAKRLAYSLNPNTYQGRNKRDNSLLIQDADVAQKEILREFGLDACILEEPCRVHASRDLTYRNYKNNYNNRNFMSNWPQVFRNYKTQSTGTKHWYLLSVFIGDATRDVPLCHLLAKRMPCPNSGERLPPPKPR